MRGDTSEIDRAIVARLAGDAALGFGPEGVFFEVARPGLTAYVIVSQLAHEDDYALGGALWERIQYVAKVVTMDTSGVSASRAAFRIHELLQDADGALAPEGYVIRRAQRLERVRYIETDDLTDTRWQHRGGHYEILAAPLALALPR